MSENERRLAHAALIGGAVCLDFTNTVSSRHDAAPRDKLQDYADLLAWSTRAGIVDERESRRLRQRARQDPDAAEDMLRRARELREAIYRAFVALQARRRPSAHDLAIVNHELANALAQSRIVAAADGYTLGWEAESERLDAPLWEIARSAADLLTSNQWRRVRACANDTCGWLFVDTSRNHSRRWCAMNDCGNRAKAHRHYARVQRLKMH
jgi:predicted RNA-binding Zn ribbon-like protein